MGFMMTAVLIVIVVIASNIGGVKAGGIDCAVAIILTTEVMQVLGCSINVTILLRMLIKLTRRGSGTSGKFLVVKIKVGLINMLVG